MSGSFSSEIFGGFPPPCGRGVTALVSRYRRMSRSTVALPTSNFPAIWSHVSSPFSQVAMIRVRRSRDSAAPALMPGEDHPGDPAASTFGITPLDCRCQAVPDYHGCLVVRQLSYISAVAAQNSPIAPVSAHRRISSRGVRRSRRSGQGRRGRAAPGRQPAMAVHAVAPLLVGPSVIG